MRVGVYASRPANFAIGSLWANNSAEGNGLDDSSGGEGGGTRNLCITFEGLEIF